MTKEKIYRIIYKNGNVLYTRAYSMEIQDGKLYQCNKALVGDQGIPSVITAKNMKSVEELDDTYYFENGTLFHDLEKMPFDRYDDGIGFIHATGREYWDREAKTWYNEYEEVEA